MGEVRLELDVAGLKHPEGECHDDGVGGERGVRSVERYLGSGPPHLRHRGSEPDVEAIGEFGDDRCVPRDRHEVTATWSRSLPGGGEGEVVDVCRPPVLDLRDDDVVEPVPLALGQRSPDRLQL